MSTEPTHDCEENKVTNSVDGELVTFCSLCNRTLSQEPDPDEGTWPNDDFIDDCF